MEEKRTRRMSEATRERLHRELLEERQQLLSVANRMHERGSKDEAEYIRDEAHQATDHARTIARIANRLAKAGAQ